MVFVVHGIRDYGIWTDKVKQVLLEQDKRLHVITPSYDYFSLLQFAWTPTRRRNLAWFRDQYTVARAESPRAPIHFVGHSNGTYILAKTLALVGFAVLLFIFLRM